MKIEALAVIVFMGLIGGGFAFSHVPQSFAYKQHTHPPAPPFIISDLGPYEHVNGLTAPTHEKLCIRATGECRTVWHPALHQLRVTFCHDPRVIGGAVFYNRKNPYCRA